MKLVAILAGAALALVPTGTAFAGGTGNGLALGNCKNSSAGGVHTPLKPEIGQGKGNGGLQGVSGEDCKTPPDSVKPVLPPGGGVLEYIEF